jgi:NAD(P)H-dependent flavin oxidoreductase YrpB (nitropropane dioxygenase family)
VSEFTAGPGDADFNAWMRRSFVIHWRRGPRVISFTLGDPGDQVRQAHAVGARVMLQVTTVTQAVQAAERAVDVIIAQGGESGGYCGEVSRWRWCRRLSMPCRRYPWLPLVAFSMDAVSPRR